MRAARILLALVMAAILVATAYSFFFADDQAIEVAARSKACGGGGPNCHAALARLVKTPFFQDREFRVGTATVEVRCTRTAILIGDYQCTIR
jgi:hypothetical protein